MDIHNHLVTTGKHCTADVLNRGEAGFQDNFCAKTFLESEIVSFYHTGSLIKNFVIVTDTRSEKIELCKTMQFTASE